MVKSSFDLRYARVSPPRRQILVVLALLLGAFSWPARDVPHTSAAAIPAVLLPCSSPASDGTPEWGIFSDEIDALDFFGSSPRPVNCTAAQLADVPAPDEDEAAADAPINSHGLTEPMAMH